MMRGIVGLALALTGLVLWDRALAGERETVREESGRLRPLLDEAARKSMVVAAVRVETSQDENFVYARSRGVWKLIEPEVGTWTAPQAIESLMQSLVDAQGVVLTEDKLRAKSYGFGSEIAMRVTFHGTKLRTADDGDVLYCVDLGYPIQGTDGAYVRPLGTHAVWAIDQNPRLHLARPPGSSFPPMLDPYVIPALAAAQYGGIERVDVERRGGTSYSIELRQRAPADVGEGEPPVEWRLAYASGATDVCHAIPATGYTMFLFRTPYEKILGAKELDPRVLEDPFARVTIHPRQGEPFALHIGDPSRTGGSVVVNQGTQTIFEIGPEVRDLLVPSPETVSNLEEGNPWHDYIQLDPMQAMGGR